MDQQYPTVAKIPMLDTGKFEQWLFRMQQYLQHEHYALWEVIEFRDSYTAPEISPSTTTTSIDKSGRTVTLTTEDMQKKKNDVKSRTTLLLSLLDEHQLQFSKHKTAKELWAAILKIFGGNEATKKTKKNLLKQGNDEVNTASVYTASSNVPIASVNVAIVSISQETACAYIASQSGGSQTKFEDINQINEDDMEEIDIKWNMALLSMRADKFWKKTGKKISIQGSDVAGFDKSKVECFNCYKMGHFTRECSAPRNQERGRRDTYRQGSKAEEQTPKALMAIDGVDCKKNNDSLNSKITDLTDKLFDAKNMIYHYKLALAQVDSRLVEYKEREVKYIKKIRTLEFYDKGKVEYIETLKKELKTLKQEKEVVDGKLAGLLSASKDLDNLIESQRSDKSKEGLGYTAVPPPVS
nr:hypothetical protein [Tanacetum cinerariifolium]